MIDPNFTNLYDAVTELIAASNTHETQISDNTTAIEENADAISTLELKPLESGADLNTLGVGRYYIPNVTVSATILNKPITTTQNAFIDVRYGATGELQQWFYINSKATTRNNKVYYRYYYENEWCAWQTGYLRPDDSGWIALTLADGIGQHSATNFPCRYRKIGNVVYVQGCVNGFADVEKTVATLPEGFRPSATFYSLQATQGGKIDTFNVRNNGKIERVSTTMPVESLSASNYHFINFSFLTD